MKISFDNHWLVTNQTIINWGDRWGNIISISPTNSHWNVGFDNGTTEGGSSGSPLFDQNRRVIGQLHGGLRGCAPITKHYGRFNVSWTGGGTNDTRLSNWLDPTNTGVMTTNTVRPPVITGPSAVCLGSTATYTLSNAPDLPVTWSGNRLTPQDNNPGTSKTFTASFIPGNGWVSASISVNGQTIEIARKAINVGNNAAIAGPDYITTATTTTYTADPECSGLGYKWVLYKHNYNLAAGEQPYSCFGKSYINLVSTRVPSGQSSSVNPYVLELYIGNELVAVKYIESLRYNYSLRPNCIERPLKPFIAAYPNPVSDVLNIEFDQEEIAQAKALNNAKSVSQELTFDIRLYDGQGNLLRQQKTDGSSKVAFNVSNFPNGIYYLHIYDGVNEKPEINQIIVNH